LPLEVSDVLTFIHHNLVVLCGACRPKFRQQDEFERSCSALRSSGVEISDRQEPTGNPQLGNSPATAQQRGSPDGQVVQLCHTTQQRITKAIGRIKRIEELLIQRQQDYWADTKDQITQRNSTSQEVLS